MSSVGRQNTGNNPSSNSNSIVAQSPNSNNTTAIVPGVNARLTVGNVRDGIYYFNSGHHRKILNTAQTLLPNVQQSFLTDYAEGGVLIPRGTHKALAEQFMRLKGSGSHEVGEDEYRNPAGVMVPLDFWRRYMEAGSGSRSRSPEWFQSMATQLAAPPQPARYSTGAVGHWGGHTASLGERKKRYMQPEWEVAQARKKEQESLAARQSAVHAKMREYHALAARTSPLAFLHRMRAKHHGFKSRRLGHRSKQLAAAAFKLQIEQERALLRGDMKNWRDASLTSGAAGRGDGRLRSLFRTLRT